jgi:hypothetical protein
MTMKVTVTPIIRAFGFRRVLIANTVICSAFLFSYSFFDPSTPHAAIFLALLAGGFFRSLQMTSINTLSYADVPSNMLSRATSLTSMAQQLSQSMGVAAGAMFLYLMLAIHGEASPGPADFSFAFAAVAMLSVLAVPFFLRMSPEAGAEVSGRPATSKMPSKVAGE